MDKDYEIAYNNIVDLAEEIYAGFIPLESVAEEFRRPENDDRIELIAKIWSEHSNLTKGLLFRINQYNFNISILEGCL